MRPRLLALLVLLLPLALSGCKIDTINSFSPTPAKVRFANFLSDAGTVDGRANDTVVWTAVAPEALTAYTEFDAEQWTFALRSTGATTDLNQSTYVLNGSQNYSLLAIGTAAIPSQLMLPDNANDPGSGNYRMRMLHLAPTWGAIDAYLTAPGASIANLSPTISTLLYGSVGTYNNYSPGNYQIRITPQGTKTVIYDSGTLALAGNSVVNAIVYTRGSGTLVNLALMQTNGSASMQVVNNNAARVRAINLAADAGKLNLLADQAAFIPDLVYATPASYTAIAPGDHSFTVESAATPGATVAQFSKTLVPATDTTVYITGTPGALTATQLDDNNVPSLAALARLRFVNVTSDATTFDVLLDATVLVSGVTAEAPPTYVSAASNTYTITIRNTATGAPILTQSGFAIGLSSVYTVYVTGTTAQPALVIVQDK